MGRYIDENLQPGEKVLYSTNAHWIFFLPAVGLWMLAAVFLALSGMVPVGSPLIVACWALAGIVALFALYRTVTAWFQHWTTETDVTNLRVVHKTGFINRQTFEMSLDKIESVDVEQSIPGRIFGYGNVTITGVGKSEEKLATVTSPLAFRNAITAR
ncbi:PH domain-containing protein [Bradyrhizobium sp.]|uniref:PH domain-containing protein n=1 Tax=Bradyrhizobium sp. TaxID=376 RepID=UPI001DB9337C|nr:PH domain-containing protein [Bradyrhizobium sp.]MBI5320685.1 PH domain-containing protein [Bradyrhizobium sp.]